MNQSGLHGMSCQKGLERSSRVDEQLTSCGILWMQIQIHYRHLQRLTNSEMTSRVSWDYFNTL